MLVTDDEIVASSGIRDQRWRGVLPSLDLDLADSLVESAARGAQSLVDRGLMSTDGTFSDVAEDLLRVIDGAVRALVFPATEERPLVPAGPTVGAIETESGWFLDVVAPEGLHDLTAVDGASGAWKALEALIGAAGVLPEDRVLSAVVLATDSEDGVFVSINGELAVSAALGIPLPEDVESLRIMTADQALALARSTFGTG